MRNNWKAADLDEFVAECDTMGGIATPEAREATRNFELKLDSEVDVNLDPFGDTYYRQQLDVYAEISGRSLDQEAGEILSFDVDAHAQAANPYATNDASFISKHCRTVLTALMIANPPAGARVLDLGAGWGLSSEMMAYSGMEVVAVDINPDSIELINRRSSRTGLPIIGILGNFDTVEPGSNFDLALFYECLHHAINPLNTLKRVSEFLGPNGRIVFAGEPINTIWWPSWGMRLDAESVYVMRKYGWFESGWSADFILECLSRAGFEPVIIPGVGIEGGDICVADRKGANGMRPLSLPPSTSPPGTAQQGITPRIDDEMFPLEYKLAEKIKELDHAKRYPWKYFRESLRMRKR